MNGKHKVIIQNNKLHYEFEVKRNITIIQGNSATGKTTLVDMLRQNMNLGASSGVDVLCDVPCRILEGVDWKIILSTLSGNIIFIDEGNAFINTEEFASTIKGSDNYFVLITRENLYNLPYSVEEIYGIHSSGRYQNTKRTYQEMYKIYAQQLTLPIKPESLIVEDSNSGYQFFDAVCAERNIACVSANGKSNLFNMIKNNGDKEICVVADGAAIGPEMNILYNQMLQNKKIKLYLPESFEWIILKSGLLKNGVIQEILTNPENYIDSKDYFSWEQYFTKLLIEETRDSYLQYQKGKLNPVYLHEKIEKSILAVMKGLEL